MIRSINSCLSTPGIFSCAVDTLADLFYYSIYLHTPTNLLRELEKAEITSIFAKLCNFRRNRSMNRNSWSKSREQLWDALCTKYTNDFVPKGRIDASIDSVFFDFQTCELFQLKRNLVCSNCNTNIRTDTRGPLLMQYNFLSESNGILNDVLKKAVCFSSRKSQCCKAVCKAVSLNSPQFLMILLPLRIENNQAIMTHSLYINEVVELPFGLYQLAGAVRSTGSHFSPIVLRNSQFFELDNLNTGFPNCYNNFVSCAKKTSLNPNIPVCEKDAINWLIFAKTSNTTDNPGIQFHFNECHFNYNTLAEKPLCPGSDFLGKRTGAASNDSLLGKKIKVVVDEIDFDRKNDALKEKERLKKRRQRKRKENLIVASKMVNEFIECVHQELSLTIDPSKLFPNTSSQKQQEFSTEIISAGTSLNNSQNLATTLVKRATNDSLKLPFNQINATDQNDTISSSPVSAVVEALHNDFLQTKNCRSKQLFEEETNTFYNEIEPDIATCQICTKVLFKEEVKHFFGKPIVICRRTQYEQILTLCSICEKSIKQGYHPANCLDNCLDPGTCKLIDSLNYIERRFINLVNSFMTIISLPGGQVGEEGQAIHFLNNITDLACQIPNNCSEADLLLLSSNDNTCIDASKCARMKLIKRCLMWLMVNNNFFAELGELKKQIFLKNECDISDPDQLKDFSPTLELSFINDNYTPPSIETLLNQSSHNLSKLFQFVKCKSQPLNIFNFNHLEEKAFVHLFPYGKNGFCQPREQRLTLSKYFSLRLQEKDCRFRRDLAYIFWALNMLEQRKLQESISVALKTYTKKDSKSTLAKVDVEKILQDRSYTFFRQIRGTAGYWINVLMNLLAMISLLGPPTWFLTLSADDLHWPDVQSLLETDMPDLHYLNNIQKLRRNPVMTVRQFRRRWSAIMRFLRKTKVLGEITDCFERVEFQSRGSPHLHIFLWIKNAPDISKDSGRKLFPNFIDQYVCTMIPEDYEDKKLVEHFQIHRHTPTCLKGKNKTCRFNFPRSECKETKLAENLNPLLGKRFYETKRSLNDLWVNPYNIIVLRTFKANMDLQFVGNCYGVATYVCNYICKAEPLHLQDAVKNILSRIKQSPELTARQKLSKLGTVFLTKRCIGSQEAVFRIISVPLIQSTRKCVYINCLPETKRYHVLLDHEVHDNNTKSINHLEKLAKPGLIEYYCLRPRKNLFEKMSLAHFSAWYNVPAYANASNSAFLLLDGKTLISRRKRAACIRSNKLGIHSDVEQYYFRLLMLHLPFRTESDLKSRHDSYRSSFLQNYNFLDKLWLGCDQFFNELEKSIQQLRIFQSNNSVDLVAEFASSTIHKNETESLYYQTDETWQNVFNQGTYDQDNFLENGLSEPVDTPCESFKGIVDYEMTDQELAFGIESLNSEQKFVFDHVKNSIQKYYIDIEPCQQQMFLFVSGQAGTGKSFLIKMIHELVVRMSNTMYGPVVLRCALTGVASHNISGITLHRALSLPVDHKARSTFYYLSNEKLADLRRLYRNLSLIIIDEISMVSYRVLTQIHLRLSQIKDSKKLFGGINVLALGDFYQLKPVAQSFVFSPNIDPLHLWNDVFHLTELTKNMRQQNDDEYRKLLSHIRTGDVTPEDLEILHKRLHIDDNDSSFDNALRVYPIKKDVNAYNLQKFSELKANSSYKSYDSIAEDRLLNFNRYNSSEIPQVPENDSQASGLLKTLNIMKGAKVMLTRNISQSDGLVNGSIGIVKNVIETSTSDGVSGSLVVKSVEILFNGNPKPFQIQPVTVKFFGAKRTVWERTQFPLVHSWATTIHKVQGLTLDKIVADLGKKIFQPGMAYVALSRVRKLDDLSLCDFDPTSLKCYASVQAYYASSHL